MAFRGIAPGLRAAANPRLAAWLLPAWLCLRGASFAATAPFGISSFSPNTLIAWTNAYPTGICCVQGAASPGGAWTAQVNAYTTNSRGQVALGTATNRAFCRLAATDITATNPNGFANLARMYGRITTIAGNGVGGVDGVNYWQSWYEGGYATNAALSRPHFAMADPAGNIFIVDKNSHSVLKVTLDGRIHTVAGTNGPGNGPDTATRATSVALNFPNGLWLGGDGAVYILDTGNSKIRWFDTNGTMTTLLTDSSTISGGRGLWVRDDRTLAYFVDGNDVKKWTPGAKIKSVNNDNFVDPGNFVVKPDGNLVVTDRGMNLVYLVNVTTGARNILAGNGGTSQVTDGVLGTASSLYGVRAVWPLPTGGWFLGCQEGSQVSYLDPAGFIHVWVNGYQGYHTGDGQWFYAPGYKVSEVRSVTLDALGNMLIVENDNGYVRRLEFLPVSP